MEIVEAWHGPGRRVVEMDRHRIPRRLGVAEGLVVVDVLGDDRGRLAVRDRGVEGVRRCLLAGRAARVDPAEERGEPLLVDQLAIGVARLAVDGERPGRLLDPIDAATVSLTAVLEVLVEVDEHPSAAEAKVVWLLLMLLEEVSGNEVSWTAVVTASVAVDCLHIFPSSRSSAQQPRTCGPGSRR